MSEKDKLMEALNGMPQAEWVRRASAALGDKGVAFVGSRASVGGTAAEDLVRIYQLRLQHVQERHIQGYGIAELIDALKSIDKAASIVIQPFLGPQVSVGAFWGDSGQLVGCVTILGREVEGARHNFDLATGNS
jgi:hypothetical protein